jgi:hypothetical protein
MHVPFEQHWSGEQLEQVSVHEPLKQAWPEPQAMQAVPPVPHSATLSAPTAMQVAPLQQPAQLPGPQAGLQAPP